MFPNLSVINHPILCPHSKVISQDTCYNAMTSAFEAFFVLWLGFFSLCSQSVLGKEQKCKQGWGEQSKNFRSTNMTQLQGFAVADLQFSVEKREVLGSC